jgi:hypothetical protein
MSMMIRLNEETGIRMISFSDFCDLTESFKPKETDYGNDGKNKHWNENESHVWTFFSHKPDHHALVHINKHSGEFGFGTHRGEFTDDVANHYDETPKHVGDALSVMNKALHVTLEGAKKYDMKSLHFKGANENLKSVYSSAIQNTHLNRHLADHGFEYSHSFKDQHFFKRK